MAALLLAWPLAAATEGSQATRPAPRAEAGVRADFNGDGAADLAIGAPGEGLGAGQGAAGLVQVLYGSAGGLTAAGSQLWSQDSPGIAGVAETQDFLGNALTAGDFNGDGRADLAAGTPGETLAVVAEAAGAVNVLYGSAGRLTAAGNQVWSQDSPGVANITQPRDVFGSALAAGDVNADGRDELAVGVPGETFDDPANFVSEAGVVQVLIGSAGGLTGPGASCGSKIAPGLPTRPRDPTGSAVPWPRAISTATGQRIWPSAFPARTSPAALVPAWSMSCPARVGG